MAAALVAWFVYAGMAAGADIGAGFGERLWTLTSARQAASGGVALEDPWRQGSLVEMSNVLLGPGLQWYGLGYQGGLGETVRIGAEAFLFSAPGITKTLEDSSGYYAGESGKVAASEWGGRVVSQFLVLEKYGWKVAALGRVTGLTQHLPTQNNAGMALELGGQGQQPLGDGRALTAWTLLGPIGRGQNRYFTSQMQIGCGLMGLKPVGVMGGEEGYSVGGEMQVLGEGLVHGGAGITYWFGNPTREGITVSLRGGARYFGESAQEFQPRGGLGILWRNPLGWGVQFDYAFVPLGELGAFNYVTMCVRLPEPERSYGPEQPGTVETPPPPEPEIIYFYPEKGEKAEVSVTLEEDQPLSIVIYDMEGKFVRTVFPRQPVSMGTYKVDWDGVMEGGVPATFDLPYWMTVTIGDTATNYKVIAKKLEE